MAGSPDASAPGESHGLPTGGPGVAADVVVAGEGLGEGEGLGVGDVVAVNEGEGVWVVALRSGVLEEHAPSERAATAAKTTMLVRRMVIAWHSGALARISTTRRCGRLPMPLTGFCSPQRRPVDRSEAIEHRVRVLVYGAPVGVALEGLNRLGHTLGKRHCGLPAWHELLDQ